MADGVTVGKLVYDLDVDDSKLAPRLQDANKEVEGFGEKGQDAGDKWHDGLNKAAAGLAVVGAGLTLISKNATDFTVDFVKDSKNLGRQIGVSTEEASRLTAAFNRMGVTAEQSSQMFGIFSKQIVQSTQSTTDNKLATQKLQLQIDQTKKSITETALEIKKHGDKSGDLNDKLKVLNNTLATQTNALKQNSDGFAKLGVSTVDASGKQKDFNTILFEVADKFKAMPDGIDKTALAMELFGRSGKDMIKVLNLGGDGIQDLEKNADKLGLTLNAQTIGNVAAYIESQKKMKEQTDALKIAVGTATTPVLTSFQTAINNVLGSILNTDGPLKTITVDLIAFGGPIAGIVSGLIAFGSNLVTVGAALGFTTSGLLAFTAAALPIAGVVAAAVADLYLLKKAADAVTGAFQAIYNAQSAVANLAPEGQMRDLQKQATAARARGDTAAVNRISKALAALGGNAGGTDNWKGGLTWINEEGPEIIDLPQGSRVIPNQLSRQIVRDGSVSGGKSVSVSIGEIHDKSDADYILRRIGNNFERVGRGLSP